MTEINSSYPVSQSELTENIFDLVGPVSVSVDRVIAGELMLQKSMDLGKTWETVAEVKQGEVLSLFETSGAKYKTSATNKSPGDAIVTINGHTSWVFE